MTDVQEIPIRQLRYMITRDDIAAFEYLPGEVVGREKLWSLLPILVTGMMLGLFMEDVNRQLPWAGGVGLILLATAAGLAISALVLNLRKRARIRNAALPSAETDVAVYATHFTVSSSGSTRSFAWRDVTVASTDEHIFLMNAPRETTTIPLRAFVSLADMHSIATFAEVMGRDDNEAEDADADLLEAKL